MKHSFAPLLMTSVIILTSLSDCDPDDGHNPYDPIFYTPISAEINGILYSDIYEGKYEVTDLDSNRCISTSPHAFYRINYDNKFLYFDIRARKLTSESGDTLFLGLYSQTNNTGFALNSKYKLDAGFGWYDFETNLFSWYDSTDGWIQFTTIGRKRIGGRFEFIVKDPKTDSILFDINNGMFYLPLYD